MNDGKDAGRETATELDDLARRFQDLWRDQMAATAADPEFLEMMGKWMGAFAPMGGSVPAMPAVPPGLQQASAGAMGPLAWMAAMQAALAGIAGKGGNDDGTKGAAPAWAAAAADASGAGHVAGDELEHRLAAIEQRLDRLEAAIAGKSRGAAKGTRRRKS